MQIAQISEPAANKAPRSPRTNMFVMATIYVDTGSSPVRVRNLSPNGALIEGPLLPHSGTRVRLCRGSLSIMGDIVWHKDGRAGLRFEKAVSVAEWLPRGRAISAQQRVDEIVQQSRRGDNGALARSPVDYLVSHHAQPTAIELTRLRLVIQSLAEDLAADPAAVVRYGSKLQALDIAAQMLRRLATERWP